MAANLSGDEAKVYELVTRHFLATCSGDARGERTQVKVLVGGEEFNTSGTMITDRGYLVRGRAKAQSLTVPLQRVIFKG